MTGDEKRRFCSHCQLHVHNLSAMSPEEVRTMISERGQRRCVAYVDDKSTIQVRAGTWALVQDLLHYWRTALAVLTAFISIAAPAEAAQHHKKSQSPPATHSCSDGKSALDGKTLTGAIIPPTPLWRRILFFWER